MKRHFKSVKHVKKLQDKTSSCAANHTYGTIWLLTSNRTQQSKECAGTHEASTEELLALSLGPDMNMFLLLGKLKEWYSCGEMQGSADVSLVRHTPLPNQVLPAVD